VDYGALSSQALVKACLDTRDALAWQEFVRRFHKLIATVVLRTARRWNEGSPHLIEELVQETYLKLCTDDCRLLRSFRSLHDDAIFGYIKVLAANLVHDHFKSSRAEKRGGSTITTEIDCESVTKQSGGLGASLAESEQKILLEQIAMCLEAATSGPNGARDRRIFWLYYRAGLAASAIASLPSIGLATKGVESTIFRITRLIRTQLVVPKQESIGLAENPKGIRQRDSL